VLHNGVNSKFSVRFRRWTRSAYAVFASLGKAISIGNLRIEMAGQTLFRGLENITKIFTADIDEASESEDLGQVLPAEVLVAAEMSFIPVSKEIEAGIVPYYNINQTVKTA
jgi:hypothetical protein